MDNEPTTSASAGLARRWARNLGTIALVLVVSGATAAAIKDSRDASTRIDHLQSELKRSDEGRTAATKTSQTLETGQSSEIVALVQRVSALESEVQAVSPSPSQTVDVSALQARVAKLEQSVLSPDFLPPVGVASGLQEQVSQLQSELRSLCDALNARGSQLNCP